MLDFQMPRALAWLKHTFEGRNQDTEERALRVLEEVNELAQAEGVTREQAHALVDQVFDKPVGEVEQEIGGVLVSLALYFALKYPTREGASRSEELINEFKPTNILSAEMARLELPETVARVRRKHDEKLVVSSKSRS